MHVTAGPLCNAMSIEDLAFNLKKVQHTLGGPWVDHVYFIKLRKLKKVRFTVQHRGEIEGNSKSMFALFCVILHVIDFLIDPKVWTVKDFSYLNCKTWKFELKDKKTGTVKPDTSIFDYFKMRYNIHLQYPTLPVVETTKKGVAFPMEVCRIVEGQRYPFKLDEQQVEHLTFIL